MTNFSTWIPNCDCQSGSFGFVSSDASICSMTVFLPSGDSDHVSVSIDFPLHSKGDDPFHRTAYDFSLLIGMVFVIIREMFHETISLNTMFLVLVVCPVNGSTLQLL